MQLINTLSDTPIQKFSFKSVDTRENIDFTLRYMPTQRSWYLDFIYNNQEFNGNKVVLSENILRMYKNIIPIGISIIADKHIEPFALDDFSSGRVLFYILNKEEVKQVESDIYGIYD